MSINLHHIRSILCQTLICLVILGISPKSWSQPSVDSSRIIRVLTYNIYHGETMNGDFDLDTIAGVIKAVKPDLVALQEVDFRTTRAKKMDLAMELGQRTGLIPLFGKAMSFSGGEYGEAILSRYTFVSTRNHALGGSTGRETRSALEVNVETGSGDTIRFIGTHLDHTREESDRIGQATKLNGLFARDDIPSILAGDLNARPESRTMQILLTEWAKSSTANAPTSPSANPRSKIDYIMFRPAHRWRVIETRVIDEKVGSDHCPFLSVLELLD